MSGRAGGARVAVRCGAAGVLAALALLVAVAFPPIAGAQEAVVEDGGTIDLMLLASVGPVERNDVVVQVSDQTGAPVTGALVTLEGSGAASTKADGTVLLAKLEVGERFAVRVTKEGYREFSGSFVCEGLAGERWQVTLASAGGQPDPDDPGDPGGPSGGAGSGSGAPASPGGGTGVFATTGDALWLAVAAIGFALCAALLALALSWAGRLRAEGGSHGCD